MRKPYSIIDIRKRLDKYTTITDGHWLYTNRISNCGYGTIKYLRKQLSVHRLSAHLYLGLDLNSPLMALHKNSCPHKNCWNPDCLYIGNHTDNMNDIRDKNVCSKCNRPFDKIIRSWDGTKKRRCTSCHRTYMRIRRQHA